MTLYSRAFLFPLILAALLATFAGTVSASMYRYVDEQGKTVITSTLPQEVVSRGYEILNNQGRVIEEVPPALTEEEIAAKERARQKELERQAAEQAQREQDRQLLRRYSSADDAVRALQRSLREMFSLIRLKQGNIENIEEQLVQQESRAANLERQGREVPRVIYQTIDRLKSKKAELAEEIVVQLGDIEQVRASYRERIERMEELTGNSRTLPLTIPEEQEISVSDSRKEHSAGN